MKKQGKKKRSTRVSRGKLIVIEGADGAGKSTQTKLLIAHLRRNGISVMHYDFPQYHRTFFGDMVARFLRGEFGKFKDASPYLVSLPYALDRASVAPEMEEWLTRGGWIVCDRYVSSHLAHQAARFDSPSQSSTYMQWDQVLEYEVLGTPREDLVICLDVPHTISATLTKSKPKRSYLRGQERDIAERDQSHQRKARDMYVSLSRKFRHWRRIRCVDRRGRLLPIASIHKLVVQSIPL